MLVVSTVAVLSIAVVPFKLNSDVARMSVEYAQMAAGIWPLFRQGGGRTLTAGLPKQCTALPRACTRLSGSGILGTSISTFVCLFLRAFECPTLVGWWQSPSIRFCLAYQLQHTLSCPIQRNPAHICHLRNCLSIVKSNGTTKREDVNMMLFALRVRTVRVLESAPAAVCDLWAPAHNLPDEQVFIHCTLYIKVT